jgi:hypothetical protein
MLKYYWAGAISLIIFWFITKLVTKSWNPFAMAKGKGDGTENTNHSASMLQMLVFTMLTVFTYTSVFAARAWEVPGLLNGWVNVPTNLLILMGISVGTAVASRAIKVEQAKTNASLDSAASDLSSLTTYHDGRTDLIKIQMLIWTLIGVVVYMTILGRFMINEGFKGDNPSLPDIDTAFMLLLGVSQGGQIVNQLTEKP